MNAMPEQTWMMAEALRRADHAVARVRTYLASHLGIRIEDPLSQDGLQSIETQLEEGFAVLRPIQRRRALIAAAPVLAELESAMALLAKRRDDASERIVRLSNHRTAAMAYRKGRAIASAS